MEINMEPKEGALPPINLIPIHRTPIQEFYKGANILVTGSTGFMGKILVEKLLRSCPEIQNLYLVIRSKKGKDLHSRLDDMFEDPIFERLKEECKKYRHKVVGISGDCSVPGLGLSITDVKRLSEEVNIVFHVAATVRFDEPMRLAMAINVHATKDLINLCRQMTHLKAIVHVSTAYSNCYLKSIEERIYDTPMNASEVDIMISKLDDRQLEDVTPKICGKYPNTYTFTKALAESELASIARGLPVGVFRPAIVVSTYKEPVIGWIDNMYGPTGVVAGASKGILRTLHCDKDMVADLVPVDMCINALITAAWDVANKGSRINEDIPVYNYVSSTQKPITWGEFMQLNLMYADNYIVSDVYWAKNFRTVKNQFLYNLSHLMMHRVPAFLMDLLLRITGRKPQLTRLYGKVKKFSDVLAYFSNNEWIFSNNNVQNMWKRLEQKDKEIFEFNMENLDWLVFFRSYIKGIRMYLFKDPLNNLEEAKKKYVKFYIADKFVGIFCRFLIIYVPWLFISTLYSILFH